MIFENTWQDEIVLHEAFINDNADVSIREVTLGGDPIEDFDLKLHSNELHYQPDLYYYWDSPIEEDYNWRDAEPKAECLCEICFDILNTEKKIIWKCVCQLNYCHTMGRFQ